MQFRQNPQSRSELRESSSCVSFGHQSSSFKQENQSENQRLSQEQLKRMRQERLKQQTEEEFLSLRQIQVQRKRQRQRLVELSQEIHDVKFKTMSKVKFEWYFSKNKTFKAFQISEEKLQSLYECSICFVNFINNPEKDGNRERKVKLKMTITKDYLYKELTELYCKHTFHTDCIRKWLYVNPKCPVCRKMFQDHEEYDKFQEKKKEFNEREEKKPVNTQLTQVRPSEPSLQSSTSVQDLLRRLGFM